MSGTTPERIPVGAIQLGVIAGLDPAIHLIFSRKMDPRVIRASYARLGRAMPAGDEWSEFLRPKYFLVGVTLTPTLPSRRGRKGWGLQAS